MELSDIFFEVVLCLVVNPLFKVMEIEDIRVADLSGIEPFQKEGEVVADFFPVENSVDHMAAKQPKFDFIPCMWMYFLVFMDRFEDMGSSRPVSEL